MSDRLVLGLAAVPMVAGVLFASVLQRGEPAETHAATKGARAGLAQEEAAAREDWPGVVAAGQAAELAAEYGGRVTEVFVRSGQRVEKGEALVRIDPEDVEASVGMADAEVAQRLSDVARASAKLEAARSRLDRMEQGAEWLAAQELDAARAEVRVGEAEVRAARALVSMGRARRTKERVRQSRHTIDAPFAGRVVSVLVDEGDTIAAGKVVARLITEDRMIKFAVPREALSGGFTDHVWVSLEGTKRPERARVLDVRPEVDSAAQLVFATASLPDQARADRWLVGSGVRVSAPLELGRADERRVDVRADTTVSP